MKIHIHTHAVNEEILQQLLIIQLLCHKVDLSNFKSDIDTVN